MRFAPVSAKTDFPAMERDLLRWWDERRMIAKYLRRNEGSANRWSFLDGPITANGPMGVHHGWGRTYKDLFQRFHTMLGERQRYQNGFDGQGLWIEVNVERELGFTSKRDIEAYGVAEFVERCKEFVRRYAAMQTQQSIRLGYWMDWDHSYHTMSDENNYTIWHFLRTCHDRGMIYKGHDVMPWCPRCSTGISEHEIVTEGYRELTHPSLFVRFPLADEPGRHLLVWTTTPWTLTSNVAAAVHPDLTYVRVRQGDAEYYLIKEATHVLRGPYTEVEALPGAALVGRRYRGPFDELPAQQGVAHRVIPWSEVSAAEGTGVVHIAPGAGAEDFALGKEHGLAVIAPLDQFGVFAEGFGALTGRHVYDVAGEIAEDLKHKGLLYHYGRHTHRYPVCWRCESELVFRLVDEWFITMDPIREEMMRVTKSIRWIPEFGLDRELDWLRNMHDWMISKKRYWGLALPIYECAECGTVDVVGSKEELRRRAVEGWEAFEGRSPHRPWVDAVKIRCSGCGSVVSRLPDVGNAWLDAGIVPFSTLTDPATGGVAYLGDRERWRQWFPADFITESFPGQYRNWFYSMLVMSTVLERTAPFRVCLGHALVRDIEGREMHKSWGNAIEFNEAADQAGVDVMRWAFCTQNPTQNLNFGYEPLDDVRRRFLIPLWNVYSFFATYANLDGFDPSSAFAPVAGRSLLDRWILARLNEVIATVRDRLADFDPVGASRPLEAFVEDLSVWYVRRGRRRYWKSVADADKAAAYHTLHEVLVTLSKALAPFVPFLSEAIYQNLVAGLDRAAPESVHLADYPRPDPALVDRELLDLMAATRDLVSLGRAARNRAKIKIRQPLPAVLLVTRHADALRRHPDLVQQVTEELNVKAARFVEDPARYVTFQLKPQFRLLGPKYGPRVSAIAKALAAMDPSEARRRLEAEGRVTVEAEGETTDLTADEVEVRAIGAEGYAAEGRLGEFAILETTLTPDLIAEGRARELVHQVQQLRKDAGFAIEDRITLYYEADGTLAEVLRRHRDEVMREVLAAEVVPGLPPGLPAREVRMDGRRIVLALAKA